jgi:Na+/proline symporter
VVERFAPPWMVSLAAIGLMAAAMSTIDTCANVTALSFGYDLLEIHRRPRAVAASRWVTAGTLAAACIFALNIGSLWDIFYLSSGVLSTAVAFPVAAVFWPRASARGVTLSSLCGFAGTGLAYLLQALGWLGRGQPEWLTATGLGYILWGGLAAVAGYWAGALLDRREAHAPDAARMSGQ